MFWDRWKLENFRKGRNIYNWMDDIMNLMGRSDDRGGEWEINW